jgi:MSHA biogenesis protein MshO
VTQAVAYICDQKAGTLTRYAGYTLAANAAARDSAAKLLAAGPKTVSVVGRFIRVCRFAWTDGTLYHGGLLSVELTLANPGNTLANNGGTLSLFHQTAVQGVP